MQCTALDAQMNPEEANKGVSSKPSSSTAIPDVLRLVEKSKGCRRPALRPSRTARLPGNLSLWTTDRQTYLVKLSEEVAGVGAARRD